MIPRTIPVPSPSHVVTFPQKVQGIFFHEFKMAFAAHRP
jgi:hypothetical protein